MKVPRLAHFALGVLAGFALAASVFMRSERQTFDDAVEISGQGVEEKTASQGQSRGPDLRSANDSGAASSELPASGFPGLKSLEEIDKEIRAGARQKHVDQLLAAGFSEERIDWMIRRVQELRVLQENEVADRVRNGVAPDPQSFAYVFDEDIRLKDEIGIAEYEKYRRALGRPMGVGVDKVLPGSLAERVGMQPGDEIISYDGKRVFNPAELTPLLLEGAAGEYVIVELIREGQTIQLSVPRGPLGVDNKIHLPFRLGG